MIFNKNIGRKSEGLLVSIPQVASAEISSNPCDTGQQIIISVSIIEFFKVVYPEDIYSDEIYSDEV